MKTECLWEKSVTSRVSVDNLS